MSKLPNYAAGTASAHPTRYRNLWRLYGGLQKNLTRNRWGVADQALVSAMNFTTTVVLARMLGVYNFGIFSVLYICLQYLNSIQLALNVLPMMSLAPQIAEPRERRLFLRGMAGYQYLLSAGCCAVVAAAFLVQHLHWIRQRVGNDVLFPFMLAVFAFQVQDWFRRLCYVKERGPALFWNDALSYTGQIAAFIALWWLHSISVSTAYVALGFTSLAAFAVGFVQEDMRCTLRETRRSVQHSWDAGRTLLMATQLQWLGYSGVYLVVVALVGVSAASGMRAAIALMGPVNVLYQLLDNIIPVRAAQIYAESGEAALARFLRRATELLAGFVGGALLLVSIFARPVMTFVFGRAYSGFAILVIWQAAYMCLSLIYRSLQYYHRTVESTTVLAQTAIAVSLVSLCGCVFLTHRYGAAGGLAAMVIGQVVNIAIPLHAAMRARSRAAVAS